MHNRKILYQRENYFFNFSSSSSSEANSYGPAIKITVNDSETNVIDENNRKKIAKKNKKEQKIRIQKIRDEIKILEENRQRIDDMNKNIFDDLAKEYPSNLEMAPPVPKISNQFL